MDKKRSDLVSDVRGQGLSVNAIILIVLGIAVLVVLIMGFTIGWARVLPFVDTNNVQSVANACETACTTDAQYDFCSVKRNVDDGVNEEFPATCEELAGEEYEDRNYGIDACPGICAA